MKNFSYEFILLDFVFTRDTDKMKKVVQWYADNGIEKDALCEWFERIRIDLPEEEDRAMEVLDMITGWAGNSDYHIEFSADRRERVSKGLPGEVAEWPNAQSC